MKHLLIFLLLLFPLTTFAKDGRDRALPDEYECPGCGGWERYREDQAYEHELEQKQEIKRLEQQHEEILEEKRKQTELLEEQNRILRDMEFRDGMRGW